MAMGHFVAFQNHRLTGLIPAGFSDSNKEKMRKRSSRRIWENVVKRFATSGHISTSPRPGFPGSQTGAKEENDHRTEQPEKGAQAISHGEGMGNFQPTVIDPPKQFSSWGVHRIYYSIVSFIVSQVLIRLLLGGIAEQKSLRESEFSLSAMITGPS